MNIRSRSLVTAGIVVAVISISGGALVNHLSAQEAQPSSGKTAGEFFKNVSTSTLQGLTVDDFIASMGVISADLGLDCADCHLGAGTDNVDWAFDTPTKKTARRMIEMVATINKTNFSGAQFVTCFSCHHGRERPATTIALDTLYSTPNEEKDDVITSLPDATAPDKTLDRYIQALGGAQRLAGLKSFVATGTSVGYEGLGGKGSFQMLAKAPDQRTVQIEFRDHPERGDSMRAFNGTAGWIQSPRGLLKEYDVTGSELDGLRLDAQLCFPGQIKQVLTNLRSGAPDTINGKDVDVVQGTSTKGILATLYFDKQSGLLVRTVRYGKSPVGRVPTQFDYDDYRDVGGIKFPFKIMFSWLDGRDAYELSQVRVNVPIDAAKFAKPSTIAK